METGGLGHLKLVQVVFLLEDYLDQFLVLLKLIACSTFFSRNIYLNIFLLRFYVLFMQLSEVLLLLKSLAIENINHLLVLQMEVLF